MLLITTYQVLTYERLVVIVVYPPLIVLCLLVLPAYPRFAPRTRAYLYWYVYAVPGIQLLYVVQLLLSSKKLRCWCRMSCIYQRHQRYTYTPGTRVYAYHRRTSCWYQVSPYTSTKVLSQTAKRANMRPYRRSINGKRERRTAVQASPYRHATAVSVAHDTWYHISLRCCLLYTSPSPRD